MASKPFYSEGLRYRTRLHDAERQQPYLISSSLKQSMRSVHNVARWGTHCRRTNLVFFFQVSCCFVWRLPRPPPARHWFLWSVGSVWFDAIVRGRGGEAVADFMTRVVLHWRVKFVVNFASFDVSVPAWYCLLRRSDSHFPSSDFSLILLLCMSKFYGLWRYLKTILRYLFDTPSLLRAFHGRG